jgi:predicted LPLAT superfamily acyltransferase
MVEEVRSIVQAHRQRQTAAEKKRGGRLGLWFFIVSLRVFGLRGAYALLYIVCPYYAIFDRSLVTSATAYIARRFPGCGWLQRRFHVYRLMVSQGKQLIDRYAAINNADLFAVDVGGRDEFLSLVRDSKQGMILLTSHHGNWQVAMTSLRKMGKPVRLVMNPSDNAAVQSVLYPDQNMETVEIISSQQYLGGVVEILRALREGHVVSIMGDRRYGAKALEVSFFGDTAWFPYSAFSLAASVNCPVVVLRAIKASAYRYVIDVSNVMFPRFESPRNRADQLRPWVQRYASLLESFANEHPYQSFLFRDVWKKEAATVTADSGEIVDA